MNKKVQTVNADFNTCLEKVKNQKFDIIYIDPPYETSYISEALKKIVEYGMTQKENTIIVDGSGNKEKILLFFRFSEKSKRWNK